ncbi:hypothetical protein Taro_043086 [Colocasia esculenta]|uniref:Cyanobacterial aminoacyl-tRNA synthetase CAAD domain-containing protein n=1 Tax=Colocasia esculenta TaxID=4460 RepID=A0A843WUP5_COLES|nr:hypothetical protein [Colocasia esculenta]
MASATASALSSTSALVDGRATSTRQLGPAPQCVGLPPLVSPPQAAPQTRAQRAGAYCRKIVRNVAAIAGGESMTATIAAPEESAAPTAVNGEATTGIYITETPEFVKTIQQAWDKVEDKYAVSTLALAGAVALCGTAGMISAIDRLPLVPGALEVVGIGYTGWFAYKNLFFKPDRQAFVAKVKDIYKEITGSSS